MSNIPLSKNVFERFEKLQNMIDPSIKTKQQAQQQAQQQEEKRIAEIQAKKTEAIDSYATKRGQFFKTKADAATAKKKAEEDAAAAAVAAKKKAEEEAAAAAAEAKKKAEEAAAAALDPYDPTYVIPTLSPNDNNINEVIKHQIDRFRQLNSFLQGKNDNYVVIPGTYMGGKLEHALGAGIAKTTWNGIDTKLFPLIKINLDLLVRKLIEKYNTGSKTRVYIGHIGDYKSQTDTTDPTKEKFEADILSTIASDERLKPGQPQPQETDNAYYEFPRTRFPPGPPSKDILHVYGANENNWKLNTDDALFTNPIKGSGQVTYFENKGAGPFGVVTMPVTDIKKIGVDKAIPVVGGFIKSRKFRFEKLKNKTRKLRKH